MYYICHTVKYRKLATLTREHSKNLFVDSTCNTVRSTSRVPITKPPPENECTVNRL
jgi:hypothetical protein